MNEALRNELRSAGWRSGTFKGFLLTSRAGIEFQVGVPRGSVPRGSVPRSVAAQVQSADEETAERLELRYRYRTERTQAEGEVDLPGGATRAAIEDAMTGVYLRVHEKPDVTRVFGGRRRAPGTAAAPTRVSPEPPSSPTQAGQGALEL